MTTQRASCAACEEHFEAPATDGAPFACPACDVVGRVWFDGDDEDGYALRLHAVNVAHLAAADGAYSAACRAAAGLSAQLNEALAEATALRSRLAACEAVLKTKGSWSSWATEALDALKGEVTK